MDKEVKTVHPSFGSICLTRVFGADRPLFMSTIRHSTTIRLEIVEAERYWRLGGARCLPTKKRMIVELSELQFAQMVTNMGMGEGTPCTFTFDHNGNVEACPEDTTPVDIEGQIESTVKGSVTEAGNLHDYLVKLKAQPRVTKKDLDEAIDKAHKVRQNLADALPFYLTRAREILESTVGDAQAQIKGFLQTRAEQLGIDPKSFNPFGKMLGGKKK